MEKTAKVPAGESRSQVVSGAEASGLVAKMIDSFVLNRPAVCADQVRNCKVLKALHDLHLEPFAPEKRVLAYLSLRELQHVLHGKGPECGEKISALRKTFEAFEKKYPLP